MRISTSRRRSFITSAACALALMVVAAACASGGGSAAPGKNGAGLSKFEVAFLTGTGSQGIVKQLGYFNKVDGIPVVYDNFQSGSDVYTAMASGSVDMGLIGAPAFAIAVAQGAQYTATWIYDVPTTVEGLTIRSSLNINSPEGLAGKHLTIATPFGTTADYMLRSTLQAAHVESDVEIINLSPPEILGAWDRGEIDGAYIWEPDTSELLSHGGKTISTDLSLKSAGYSAPDVGFVKTSLLKEDPGIVNAFLVANNKANTLIESNSEAAVSTMMKAYGVTSAVAQATITGNAYPVAGQQKAELTNLPRQLHLMAEDLYKDGLLEQVPSQSVYNAAVASGPVTRITGQ
jgi:taurine transport system substrate-binding protein